MQILLRDYDFTSNPVITDDDIIATFPIVKHTDFRVSPSLSIPRLLPFSVPLFLIFDSPWNQLRCMKWHYQNLVLVRYFCVCMMYAPKLLYTIVGQIAVDSAHTSCI